MEIRETISPAGSALPPWSDVSAWIDEARGRVQLDARARLVALGQWKNDALTSAVRFIDIASASLFVSRDQVDWTGFPECEARPADDSIRG